MNNFEIKSDFNDYIKVFLEENAKINLISKNEEKFLFEKHIYDSLSVKLFFKEYNFTPKTILDIGTGGGFPAIPIAIEYPDISVYGIDSIRKKVNAVENIANQLNLKNITLINDRVENIKNQKFEMITSRAVAKITTLVDYAYPLLENNGYLVLYKSKTANEEMDEAISTIRKYRMKIKPMIEYTLPLDEQYIRNLVILQKQD